VKQTRTLLTPCCLVAAMCAILFSGVAWAADSMTADVALLVQRTPEEGGTVTPATGVLRYALDEQIQLTATPKPGFNFSYWLGDVSDAKSRVTTARVDKPKIIIAVFEKIPFQTAPVGVGSGGRVVSPGVELAGSASSSSSSSDFSGGTGGTRERDPGGERDPDPDPDPDPEVPEPATCVLLLTGGLLALRKKR